MGLVCVDTQVLIWGIKEEATPGQEDMIRRAKLFFESLSKDGDQGLIPSVVVGEFLVKIPPSLHPTVLNLLRSGFVTAPFDLKAASLFAKIMAARHEDGVFQALQESGAKRGELKADCLIVATAVASGANVIVSHDQFVARVAEGYVDVRQLPAFPEQTTLGF